MDTLAKWHRTKLGLLAFGAIELAVAYGWVSLAIDRGNVLYYILALVFLVGALQNFVKFIRKIMNGKHEAS